jgi:hypothetical protein
MKKDPATTIVNVPCPDCGELSPEPIERIVQNENGTIPCSLCAGLIDLSADDCKSIVSNAKILWRSVAS